MCAAIAMLIFVALAACSPVDQAQTSTLLEEERVGGPPVLRRLSQTQYQQTVADIFGADINSGGQFGPEIRRAGLLTIGAGHASIPAAGIEQYLVLARNIATQVVDKKRRETLIACPESETGAIDDVCAKQFLSQAGRLLFRRPLTTQEFDAQLELYNVSAKLLDDGYAGIEASLASMLGAPQFLFNWEVTEADPQRLGEVRLDGYSKAARLSFFLWNTAPDDELLAAAGRGELHTANGLRRQAERLLASPRLEAGMRAFFSDMLALDGFDNLAKDTELYPQFTAQAVNDAREQVLRVVIDHLLKQSGDYRDLFTIRKTFLTRRLGAVYRLPVQAVEGWEPYQFSSEDARGGGILTLASFVALHSHPSRTSPTLRGKALRELILCQEVPDPPGNVDFNVVQDTSNPQFRTVRQRLSAHATEPMCTGCHKLVDPIGLAMEHFDTVGGYRAAENGVPIDTSGALDGIEFQDVAGLGMAMHDHPATTSCVVNRLYSFAVAREATKAEREWLSEDVQKSFARDGYRFEPLLRHMVMRDAFFRATKP